MVKRIQNVVIAGRDEALWLTANALWRAFRRTDMVLTVIELPSLWRPGDVIPTLKTQAPFHQLLGVGEKAIMAATGATYSLGQQFTNWSKVRAPFMHAYSSYGMPINRVGFLHHWLKAHQSGLKASFDDFSLGAVAAKQGRFFLPDPDTEAFASVDYGYHLSAKAYVEALKNMALHRKITHFSTHSFQVDTGADNNIAKIILANGECIQGDFFIDATGSDSLLLGKACGVEFDSWRQWFPCNRMVSSYTAPMTPVPAFSQACAFRNGWQGLYPLRDCTAMQQVYNGDEISDEEALESAHLLANARFHPQAVVTPFEAGRRKKLWSGNCMALGEAGVVMDPIDSARAAAILIGISHLINLFPIDTSFVEAAAYNQTVADGLDRVRDYQIVHFKLNQRFDQPLWDYCRQMSVPDTLAYKLSAFSARGIISAYDEEIFSDDEWAASFIGHGLIPAGFDPMVEQAPTSEVITTFQKMLGFIRQTVEPMRPMETFLSSP